MGYRIDIDHSGCITCGICMDVCPVEALDMSRPQAPGVETGPGPGRPLAWMMEHPLQVGECIGCGICIGECPPNVMTLVEATGEVPLAARQGPIDRPADVEPGTWLPLSHVTREALKPVHDSPWGDLFTWRTRSRPQPWQVWTSMVDDAPPSPIAPCQGACPAGTDAGRYVGLIGAGRFDEAYAVAAEVNPFPSVCGWICTAPCESACRRGVLDEPIAIRTLKRFAAEHGTLPKVEPPAVRRPERVAIVGGGPAGMSAAWYLARLGYPVTVFEAMPVPGGMSGDRDSPVLGCRGRSSRRRSRGSSGSGSSLRPRHRHGPRLHPGRPRARGLPGGLPRDRCVQEPAAWGSPRGDELRGVVPATLFLKEVNLGDGHHLLGDVVVVGGGSTAMDAARSARRSGAETVTIAYRRGRQDMPGQREKSRQPSVRASSSSTAWHRPRSSAGTSVMALRCNVLRADEAPGADGRATWSWTGETRELPASAILVAIGEEPDPSILPEGAGIEVSGWAGIVADPKTLATGRAGIFAGGDVVSGPRTIIEAVAAGRRAAASIHEYLAGARDGEAEILAAVRYPTAPEASLSVDLVARPRIRAALPVVDIRSFSATASGFTGAEAHAEAGRCFRCDAVYGCPSVQVTAGRGPADGPRAPDPEPAIPLTAAGPADQPAQGGVQ